MQGYLNLHCILQLIFAYLRAVYDRKYAAYSYLSLRALHTDGRASELRYVTGCTDC